MTITISQAIAISILLLLSTPTWADVCPLLKKYPPAGWKVDGSTYSRGAYWKSAVIEPNKVICRYRTSKYIPIVITREQAGAKPKSRNWEKEEGSSECHHVRKMCQF